MAASADWFDRVTFGVTRLIAAEPFRLSQVPQGCVGQYPVALDDDASEDRGMNNDTDGISSIYGPGARSLQEFFDSRRLADRLSELTLHSELTDDDIALVTEQSTAWISTVDAEGWPDVSYKGGAPGFVRVVGRTEVQIPIYDGNGMFRSLGNVIDTGRVALLFVDTSRPWRIRIHGQGRVSTNPNDLAAHHGAQAVLVVTVLRAFPNCGRYIHRGDELSTYVPTADHEPPVPDWKRLPILREALPKRDLEHLDHLDHLEHLDQLAKSDRSEPPNHLDS